MDSEKFKEFVALTEALPQIDGLVQRFGTQQAFTVAEGDALVLAYTQMATRRNVLIAELSLPIEPLKIAPPAAVEPVAADGEEAGGDPWS